MTEKRLLKQAGAPSFCWQCWSQLQRAPGKGLGLFFFALVQDPTGAVRRVHGDCVKPAVTDGCREV